VKQKNEIVDETWQKLYRRIEQDGLLSSKPYKKTLSRKRQIVWRSTAAAIAICIGVATTFFMIQPDSTGLLAIYNEKDAPTLATTLEDGSIIFLDEQASIQYPPHFAEDKREVILQGNAFFNVRQKEKCPIKICDPAVGSGHFLVSALNEMISSKCELGILIDKNGKRLRDYKISVENDELIVSDNEFSIFKYIPHNHDSQRVQETLFHEKQIIIENCLFGVDINPNSVKICQLRLWVELLKHTYYRIGY
jgi:hypothetical protein